MADDERTIHDHTQRPDSVIVSLTKSLDLVAFERLCPERTVAHLGFEEPVVMPCGLSQYHDGLHRYPIAPDALREAVLSTLLAHGVTFPGAHHVVAVEAVLAVVAKHRDAEVERLTERVHAQNRRLIGQRNVTQDRIARALAACDEAESGDFRKGRPSWVSTRTLRDILEQTS